MRRRLRSLLVVAAALFILVAFAGEALAQKTVHVRGYTRKDGTVVQPYDRRAPVKPGALAPMPAPVTTTPPVTTDGQAAAAQDQAKKADDNGDTLVYITKTGKKYHADGCRSLSKSRIPINLRDAVARGFTACSICKPPALKVGQEAAVPSTAVPPAPAARSAAPQDNGDVTVYITRTVANYHQAGCRSLARSSIPIKLRDAVARGYGACKLCNPPTLTQK